MFAKMLDERVMNIKAAPLDIPMINSITRDVIHSLYSEAVDTNDVNNLLKSYDKLLSTCYTEGILTSDQSLDLQISVRDLASQLYVNKTGHNVTVRTFMNLYSTMNSSNSIDIAKLVEQGQPQALRDICYLGTTLRDGLIRMFHESEVLQRITTDLIYENDFNFITKQSETKLNDWLELLKYLGLIDNFDAYVWECRSSSQMYDEKDIDLHRRLSTTSKGENAFATEFQVKPIQNNAATYLQEHHAFLNYTLSFRKDMRDIEEGTNMGEQVEKRKKEHMLQMKMEHKKQLSDLKSEFVKAEGTINSQILELKLALKQLEQQSEEITNHYQTLHDTIDQEYVNGLDELDKYYKAYEDSVMLEQSMRPGLYKQEEGDRVSDNIVSREDYAKMVHRAEELGGNALRDFQNNSLDHLLDDALERQCSTKDDDSQE